MIPHASTAAPGSRAARASRAGQAGGGLGRLLLLVGLQLLANQSAAAQEPDKQEADPLAPARAYGIDGVGGFKTISKVEFIGYPDAPHEWTAIYAYPDRARWSLRPTTGKPTSPMIVQRFGARSWRIAAGTTQSKADDPKGPRTTLIQMELRRATTIWPRDFKWSKTEQGLARAEVHALQHEKHEPPIGYLLARQTEDGTLLGMQAFQSDGLAVEELQIQAWETIEGRSWPSEMLLLKQGQPVWKETLSYASARGYHSDILFLPPDRREGASELPATMRALRHIDLPEVTLQLKELPKRQSWERALKLAKAELRQAQARLDEEGLSLQLDQVPAFLLDAEARPTHLILRLKSSRRPAPAGWRTLSTRPGVGTVLGELSELDPALLGRLRSSLPSSTPLDQPYCRVLSLGNRTNVQVYQPCKGS